MLFLSLLFKHLKILAKNIHDLDTPFTLENVMHIKSISHLMIFVLVIPEVLALLYQWIMHIDLSTDFSLMSIILILIIYSLSFIFEYGYEIQLDSKGKMYGIENE